MRRSGEGENSEMSAQRENNAEKPEKNEESLSPGL
jgi:hypothetical protein